MSDDNTVNPEEQQADDVTTESNHNFDKGLSKAQQRISELEKQVAQGSEVNRELLDEFRSLKETMASTGTKRDDDIFSFDESQLGDIDPYDATPKTIKEMQQLRQRLDAIERSSSQSSVAEEMAYMKAERAHDRGEFKHLAFEDVYQKADAIASEKYGDVDWNQIPKKVATDLQNQILRQAATELDAATKATPTDNGDNGQSDTKGTTGSTKVLTKGVPAGQQIPDTTPPGKEGLYQRLLKKGAFKGLRSEAP